MEKSGAITKLWAREKEWGDFEWFEDVRDLRPRVIMDEKVSVEFYTYSEYISRAVY